MFIYQTGLLVCLFSHGETCRHNVYMSCHHWGLLSNYFLSGAGLNVISQKYTHIKRTTTWKISIETNIRNGWQPPNKIAVVVHVSQYISM